MGDVVSLHAHRPPSSAAPAGGYTCRSVAELLGVPERRVRAMVRAGVVRPVRGRRGELLFSFSDLALLRMLRPAMAEARSLGRLREALERLLGQLPGEQPLSGVRLTVEGGQVVVQAEQRRWLPASGQALLDFQARPLAGIASLDERRRRDDEPEAAAEAPAPVPALPGDDWYARGCELESDSPVAAQAAYRRALEENGAHPDAHINLGRLLHEAGALAEAAEHYRLALEARPSDPIAAFNLGVALQDLGRSREAVVAYEQALDADPSFADAHCNLARLLAEAGHKQAALQHYHLYRKLRPQD